MKKISIYVYLFMALLLSACDHQTPRPIKAEGRYMHIAGMPVYEKDYKLMVLNESPQHSPQ